MEVFAIKHTPTGGYLALRPKHKARGFTHDEPVASTVRLPRLFASRRGASLALSAWLKGVWNIRRTGGYNSYDGYDEYEEVIDIVNPDVKRDEKDMEIVQLQLEGI